MNKALVVLTIAGGLALAACSVTTETSAPRVGGYDTYYASDVPPDVYSYPRTEYEGGYAYYVHDHWVYPTSGGWVRFREEPPQLVRHRGYVQGAPPAAPPAYYRGEHGEHGEHERGEHERREAPPAERVR